MIIIFFLFFGHMLNSQVSLNNLIFSPDSLEIIQIDNIDKGKNFDFFLIEDLNKRAELIFRFKTDFDFNQAIVSFSPKMKKDDTIFYFIELNKKRYFLGNFSVSKSFSFPKEDEDVLIDVDLIKFKRKIKSFDVGFSIVSNSKTSIKLINIILTDTEKKNHYKKFLPLKNIKLPIKSISQMIHQVNYNQDICSPTSLAMVLDYYGVKIDTLTIANSVYDNSTRIYGNWLFNTSYVSSLGLYSFVARLNSYDELYKLLVEGIPVVASITYDYDQLKGSPIKKTKGHLVVIKGIDIDGSIIVNDPAARDEKSVEIKYDQKEFFNAWFLNKFGTSYIIVDEKRINKVVEIFRKMEGK